MKEIENLWQEIIKEECLINALFSNVRNKNETHYNQVKIKPILMRDKLYYQFEYVFETKVTHENISPEEVVGHIMSLSGLMKQINVYTAHNDYQVLISKKLKVTVIKKNATKSKKELSLSHNRKKQYVFEEGIPIPFLVELGIMSKEGHVIGSKYDKFRQINRFVEMVRDVAGELPQNKKLRIIDFGCGKSYLTFALHYYLTELCGLNIEVVGLDLKEDVINTCNHLAKKLNLNQIHFLVGDIKDYTGYDEVDMVVTLHACNTATDAAIAKAVKWNAKIILSVPCCHHELYTQIESDILAPLLDYGIIKERFAALATDGIRAQILQLLGYKTQLVEFIDLEHTPKNILIRGVKADTPVNVNDLVSNYKKLTSFLSAKPSLEKMLEKELNEIKGFK